MPSFNRRHFLKLAGGLLTGTAIAGCKAPTLARLYPEAGPWPTKLPEPIWRTLSRITFGPRAEECQHAAEIGLAAFIEEQLATEALEALDWGPALTLRRLETVQLDPSAIFDEPEETVTRELQQAALLSAIYSRRQLYEVMVDFWTNHFNITQIKGDCAWLKTVDDREVIRPHALENFHDLLSASAHSPAMLVYLDNQENYAGRPNENYARELMELHTLGVDSGYTQQDVQELARCLTGWTVKEHFYRGQFTFDADRHDDGSKQILGLTIPAGAQQTGGEQVIEMLANHPWTAQFIATKLARRFIADASPGDLVNRAAQTFLHTRGDIKAVLRSLLLSPEFLTSPPSSSPPRLKLKRPLEFIASALRQLNAQTDGGPALLAYLAEMGQPLFQWPTPDGFPDRVEAWSGSLLTRWRFALALVNDEIEGTMIDWTSLENMAGGHTLSGASQGGGSGGAEGKKRYLQQFAGLLLGQPLPEALAGELLQASGDEKILVATLLGSPAFQWK